MHDSRTRVHSDAVASLSPIWAVRHNLLPCATVAFATAWALLFRFSSLFFGTNPSVAASNLSSVCVLAVLGAGAVLFKPLRACMASPRGRATLVVDSTLAATLAGAIALFGPTSAPAPSAQPALAGAVALGALSGLGFLGCSCAALRTRRQLDTKASLPVAAAGLTAGFALYLGTAAAYPVLGQTGRSLLALGVTALPCLAGACWVLSERVDRPGRDVPDMPEAPAGGTASGTSHGLGALPALTGFLAVFMTTMYPKTTNCAPSALGSDVCLGLASVRCVVALVLCCILLWAASLLLRDADQAHGERHPTVIAACALGGIAAFASVFFSLPSMSSSSIPFVLVTACSIPLALATAALLARREERRLQRGLAAMAGSGLAAAVFSCVFLGPLYGVFPYQDTLFSVIPAVALVLVAFSGFWLWSKNGHGDADQALRGNTASQAAPADSTDPLAARRIELGSLWGLTKREAQVLELLAAGRNEPYIEQELGISRTTVKTHIAHVYRKAGVASRQQLIDALRDKA